MLNCSNLKLVQSIADNKPFKKNHKYRDPKHLILLFPLKTQLIEWNGYETRQTPLLYVFVDLKVHNVQKNSYHFDCIDQ